MSILQDIYNESYFPSESVQKTPQALQDKRWAFFDEIEKGMGVEFIERHWGDLSEFDQQRDYANFREGFRLGVSLMLEAL